MYYPIGWHKVLKLDLDCDGRRSEILTIRANHENELYLILTTKSIHIWYPRPAAEIVCHRRSQESLDKIGFNKTAVWRTDSSVIVVATELDQLLFYQIRRRVTNSATSFILPNSSDDHIYRLKNDTNDFRKLFNGELTHKISKHPNIPALTMFSFGKLDLSSIGVTCLMSAQEELIVGTRNGQMYGIKWDGNVDDKFPWSLPSGIQKRSDYPVDIKFSSVLAGFAIVFRSGRVGFMPSNIENQMSENDDMDTINSHTEINYLESVDDAVCTGINHRHKLVAFGLKDSRTVVCNIGDSNISLVINHVLKLDNHKQTNTVSKLGKVACLQYSPDDYAIAISWEGGDLALWTVFGSLLFCTSQWRLNSGTVPTIKSFQVSSLAWGREGYSLWLCASKDNNDNDNRSSTFVNGIEDTNGGDHNGPSHNSLNQENNVVIMSMARCNLSSSPHQTCSSDSLVLVTEDKLFVGPSVPQEDKFDHWICINIPQNYLDSEYPIRYATVNRECKTIAVAGERGLALYFIEQSEWLFFSKKSQAECFTVCGDLIWWNEYLVASCFNLNEESYELRTYRKCDNNPSSIELASVQRLSMEIIRMSIFENRLLVLYSDGTMSMFMLNLRRKPKIVKNESVKLTRSHSLVSTGSTAQDEQKPDETQESKRSDSITSRIYPMRHPAFLDKDLILQISPIENLIVSNLQANPFCISAIALTRLHFKNYRTDDSILLNACGKLFLLERGMRSDHIASTSTTSDVSTPDLKETPLEDESGSTTSSIKRTSNSIHLASASLRNNVEQNSALSNITFKAVSVIATNVEQFWISPEISVASEMSYFKKSLWLSCGGSTNRLQIWLPLLNDQDDPPNDLYVPDRIMLPIRCDIYPLAIRSSSVDIQQPDDVIVLGAECDVLYRDCKLFSHFPYATVKRQCRVYLHRILRELLLSQHLGYYAKKIAEGCRSLPYFSHCFELLLHEVLEEEATSPVPLPDPMLPQVVKFIKQFSVYLETVVHCARKSELSMWSYLFDESAVGNPKKLFQECIDSRRYDIAASCLIILQSLDKNVVSSRMIRDLLVLVKEDPTYDYLVKDLESFSTRAELENLSLNSSPVNSSVN